MKWLVQSLLKSLLIFVVFIPFATFMPIATVWLCRTPWGGQIVFWVAPWSACFWALVLTVFVGSKFWRGRGQVLTWRASRGGYVRSCLKSTGVMFLCLALSYAAEFSYILLVPPSPAARQFLPVAIYAPVALAVLWAK
jgi:hypothetical protein